MNSGPSPGERERQGFGNDFWEAARLFAGKIREMKKRPEDLPPAVLFEEKRQAGMPTSL
ncbi:MAG: hypothetical protein ABI162_04975 [Luteolibacter sp.]